MNAGLFWLLVVLIVFIPLSGLVTIIMFWRNPFLGSMFASLHIVVAGSVRLASPEYNVALPFKMDTWFSAGEGNLTLTSGNSDAAGYVILFVALMVFLGASLGYLVVREDTSKRRKVGIFERIRRAFAKREMQRKRA